MKKVRHPLEKEKRLPGSVSNFKSDNPFLLPNKCESDS